MPIESALHSENINRFYDNYFLFLGKKKGNKIFKFIVF